MFVAHVRLFPFVQNIGLAADREYMNLARFTETETYVNFPANV